MEEKHSARMTDAERLELAKKLDGELDEFINGLEKKPYEGGWPEECWEKEMEKHPFFMKKAPQPGDELHPLYEGLQQLKYDPEENTPEELALSYKEDGNFNFKHRNYRLAILSYTEGIKVNCNKPEIEASLLNNRSAAQYFLKNYRSCLRDCELALKIKSRYEKVIMRAVNCCYVLEQYQKCLNFCDQVLEMDPTNKEALNLRRECITARKSKERDDRRRELASKNETKREKCLMEEIQKRKINIENGAGSLKLASSKHFLEVGNHRVYLDENNNLIWPVVFLYPEYRTSDLIEQFSENDRFIDHLNTMFEDFPAWDDKRTYEAENLNVYFENPTRNKIFAVDVTLTLRTILSSEMFLLRGGTPSFIVFVRDSLSEKSFLDKY